MTNVNADLEYWRKHFKGATVELRDGGHRIFMQRAEKCGGWVEALVASGQVIFVGDWEPIIFRDYRDRDMIGWLRQVAGIYAQSPGYGAEKIGNGLCAWWSAAASVVGSPICDLERAQTQAREYLNEWLRGDLEEGEQPDAADCARVESAVDEVGRAETLDAVYSAVMEVCPDAFEARFGRDVPEGLWRCAAAAEVMIAHLESLESKAGEVAP